MRSSVKYAPFFTAVLLTFAAAATAAQLDLSDPRRALGREDDIRIDAQLMQDTVSPNSTISVACRIENLSANAIAIADRVTDVTFDANERTLNLSIGAEVPNGHAMPHMVVIAPGEKKTLAAGGSVHGVVSTGGPFAVVPRYVQIRVNVLRDLTSFRDAIAKQSASPNVAVSVTSDMFDRWLDANDSISLNALPVRWNASAGHTVASAADEAPAAGRMW